jgi:hypothetical protein
VPIYAIAESHDASLSGTLGTSRPSGALSTRATFKGCSASQQSALNTAATDGNSYASNAKSYANHFCAFLRPVTYTAMKGISFLTPLRLHGMLLGLGCIHPPAIQQFNRTLPKSPVTPSPRTPSTAPALTRILLLMFTPTSKPLRTNIAFDVVSRSSPQLWYRLLVWGFLGSSCDRNGLQGDLLTLFFAYVPLTTLTGWNPRPRIFSFHHKWGHRRVSTAAF